MFSFTPTTATMNQFFRTMSSLCWKFHREHFRVFWKQTYLAILAQSGILCFSLGNIIRLRNIVHLNYGWLNHGKGNNFFHWNTIFVSVVGYLCKGPFNKMSLICRSVKYLIANAHDQSWAVGEAFQWIETARWCIMPSLIFIAMVQFRWPTLFFVWPIKSYELQVSFIWNVDITLQSGNSS